MLPVNGIQRLLRAFLNKVCLLAHLCGYVIASALNLCLLQTALARFPFVNQYMPVPSARKLTLTALLAEGGVGRVYSGQLTTPMKHVVVAKVAKDKKLQALLSKEAKIYEALLDLQGSMVPKIYGLFVYEGDLMLVMGWMGNPVQSFGDLSSDQQ